MDRASWSYISGRVTVLTDRLLDRRTLLGLFEAADADERRGRLRASLLYEDAVPGERPAEEIEDRFATVARQLAGQSPDGRIARFFLLAAEWTSFRRFAKAALLGKAPTRRGPDQEADPREEIYRELLRGEAPAPEWQRFAQAGAAMAALARRPEDAAGAMDLAADAAEAGSMLDAARECESEELTTWVREWLTLRAALVLLRARRNGWDMAPCLEKWVAAGFNDPALKDLALGDEAACAAGTAHLGLKTAGARTGGAPLSELARAIDDRMTEMLRGTAGIPFGPERVFAFLWALRNEATNLRTVLMAAESGMARERVELELRAAS